MFDTVQALRNALDDFTVNQLVEVRGFAAVFDSPTAVYRYSGTITSGGGQRSGGNAGWA